MSTYRIENCAGSAESARRAELGGAYRVELCAGLPEGGTTPSYGEILTARRAISIKLNVIIRPRSGDFLYTPIEVEAMLADIRMARELGADGIVVGCLTADGAVDKPLLRRFVEAAEGLPVTFHRRLPRSCSGAGGYHRGWVRSRTDLRRCRLSTRGSRRHRSTRQAGCRSHHHHAWSWCHPRECSRPCS